MDLSEQRTRAVTDIHLCYIIGLPVVLLHPSPLKFLKEVPTYVIGNLYVNLLRRSRLHISP